MCIMVDVGWFARFTTDRVAALVVQAALFLLELALWEYALEGDASDPRHSHHHSRGGVNADVENTNFVRTYTKKHFGPEGCYCYLTVERDGATGILGILRPEVLINVHFILFVGFEYLMTYFRRYWFGGSSFSFLLAALVLQWAIIVDGLFNMGSDLKILINLKTLLKADISTTTVLISSGSMANFLTPVQLLTFGCVETVAYNVARLLGRVLQVADVGGAVSTHVFAAFFAVPAALVVTWGRRDEHEEVQSERPCKEWEMIGVLMLWVLWPGWHAAWAEADGQQRAVINTILALAAGSTLSLTLRASLPGATLAAGVAVGSTCDLMIQPWGACFIGILGSVISSIRFPWDKNAILAVHGFPGILAGIIGVVVACLATEQRYHSKLYRHYPAMAPTAPTDTLLAPLGLGREPYTQAGYQALALVGTVLIAVLTGTLTGLILRIKYIFRQVENDDGIRYVNENSWILQKNKQGTSTMETEL